MGRVPCAYEAKGKQMWHYPLAACAAGLDEQVTAEIMVVKTIYIALFLTVALCSNVFAQKDNKQMVRLAKLVIDSAQLKSYNSILKEEIEASLKIEPGVLTLYPMSEKNR